MTEDKAGSKRSIQERVRKWLVECLGRESADDKRERSFRFIEEALELVQACGMPEADALAMLHYVYARPVGEVRQEIGGTVICLAALCEAHGNSMHAAADLELGRCWHDMDKIRARQAEKHRAFGGSIGGEKMLHPCECKDYNGGQCYNCLNGFHGGCSARNCKARDSKSPGVSIVPGVNIVVEQNAVGRQQMPDTEGNHRRTEGNPAACELLQGNERPSGGLSESDSRPAAPVDEHDYRCPKHHTWGKETRDNNPCRCKAIREGQVDKPLQPRSLGIGRW